ncbi:multidrug efflux ABC transporter permease LieB [Myceligenerans cantabricum]
MLHDTSVLTGRLMKQILRSPDTIITVALTPIAIFLLFRYVFGGAIDTGGANYTNYLLPGILLITVASSVAYTALRIFNDTSKGITARLGTMPISRASVLWSHVLTSLVSNGATTVLIIGVALVMGFRPEAGLLGWLAALGVLALFTLTLTWMSVIPGLTATTMEGAGAFSYPLIFLPFLSSAFAPTGSMPGPVRWFAENQPVTSVVETLRALFEGRPVGDDIWVALAWILGVGILCYVLALRTYRRKV